MNKKDKDQIYENNFKKNNHQNNHNEKERKSKTKKRKMDDEETFETGEVSKRIKNTQFSKDKIGDIQAQKNEKDFSKKCFAYEKKKNTDKNISNDIQPDILKKKKKKKKKNLMDKVDIKDYEICNDYDDYQVSYEEKRKSKSRKRKKYQKETQEIGPHEESHGIRITNKVSRATNSLIKDSEENFEEGKRKKCRTEHFTEGAQTHEKGESFDNDIVIYKQQEVLNRKKKKRKYKRNEIDLDDQNKKLNEEGESKENKCLHNTSQTEVFKEKKKKKRKKEKLKNDNSNLEIGKLRETNEGEEEYIQNKEMLSDEQSISDENSEADDYIESIQSLYSHEYTNDPSSFSSRSETSKKGKKDKRKKSTIEMYEDFIYKPPITNENQFGEIEKFLDKDSFWKKHDIKYKGNSFPEEEIEKDLLERVKYIADYFDRFANDDLTEEECQERDILDFRGPYLPTPRHIKFFGGLEIELDWEMSEEQQLLLSFHSLKELKESGVPYIIGQFDRSEDAILFGNWQEFKEKYKFDDLRPLISFRTMKINHEEGCYNFEAVDYISEDEKHKFCLYMSRGLEKRNIFQIRNRLMHLALRIRYFGISYDPLYIEPREAAEIEGFIKLFGTNYKGMEFIIGKLNASRYKSFSQVYVKYRSMPVRIGQWQSTEKCRLVRSIFKATGASNIQELLHSKVAWKEVFYLMQTRFHFQCRTFFTNQMSRFLELASHISNHKTDSENIYWTAADRVKLILLVSDNLGPSIGKIDWEEVCSNFEVFGPFSCAHQFRSIYNKLVPRSKKKRDSMEEAIDYLIEFVIPRIESGELTFKEEVLDLNEIRSLPRNKGQALKTSDKWSLSNTIKLIKEVYENAGSSVETTNWEEIGSCFIEYDETDCRNHFRFLYYNRIPHQYRESFDSALEYLKNRICPMLENKKQRNRKELLLTEEVVKLSPEDHLILRALLNDISNADDDEDIAMLQEEKYNSDTDTLLDHDIDHDSQSTPNDSHEISENLKTVRLNALSNYIQEKQEEDDIDGNSENILSSEKLNKYINDFENEGGENLNLHLSTDDEFMDNSVELC